MTKSARRAGPRREKTARPRTPAPLAKREPRDLLERILDTPHLAHVVPRLPPELLHQVILRCGLEDCGELVALATPGQLARVFDLDLWHAGQPGLDERFDADRFGVWLEVLIESGGAVAQTLAGIDPELVIAALAQHARVFDRAAALPAVPDDGDDVVVAPPPSDALSCEVGGYLVVATRTDSWDAIVAALTLLDAEQRDYFHRVMRGCRNLSNSGFEIDGLNDLLDDRAQATFDLAFDRERRREQQGYVTPAQARAFLKMSRQLPLAHDTAPPLNPVSRAYLRALEWTPPPDASADVPRLPAASGAPPAADAAADAVGAMVEVLLEAGVLPQPPRALLEGAPDGTSRLARIQAHLQSAHDRDPAAYSMRNQELAYLANTIIAGCSIQARPFTAQEASDAAVAACNLGLEHWPPHWLQTPAVAGALPDDFLVDQDLIGVFQVGWAILYSEVSMDTAGRLIGILKRLRCDDRETQAGLNALRVAMTKGWRAGTPWDARDALEAVAILDMPAWATLLGLIDECPVMHAAIAASRGSRTLSVSASAFEFISERSQIAAIRGFMDALPDTLRG